MIPKTKISEQIMLAIADMGCEPQPGDKIVVGVKEQVYEVVEVLTRDIASRRWRFVIWQSGCLMCGAPFVFVKRLTHFQFPRCCEDHWAQYCEPKEENADDLAEAKAGRYVHRLGAVERHVTEVIAEKYRNVDSVWYEDLLTACAAALPAPEEGARDSRRGRVARALKNLAGKNGLLDVTNGKVKFLE